MKTSFWNKLFLSDWKKQLSSVVWGFIADFCAALSLCAATSYSCGCMQGLCAKKSCGIFCWSAIPSFSEILLLTLFAVLFPFNISFVHLSCLQSQWVILRIYDGSRFTNALLYDDAVRLLLMYRKDLSHCLPEKHHLIWMLVIVDAMFWHFPPPLLTEMLFSARNVWVSAASGWFSLLSNMFSPVI